MPDAQQRQRSPRRGYGDLAQAVLGVLDQARAPMTPAQVRGALDATLAYTTVMTVMTRLHDRGLLTRRRAGRAYAYLSVGDAAQVTARRMFRLLDVGADRSAVLARFVDGLTGEDERVLRDLLTQISTGAPREEVS